jgi:anaerobic C4-dicarboxylate transporter
LSVAWRGERLSADANYQQRLATGAIKPMEAPTALEGNALFNARAATLLFVAGIAVVVVIGMFPDLRPVYDVAGERDRNRSGR